MPASLRVLLLGAGLFSLAAIPLDSQAPAGRAPQVPREWTARREPPRIIDMHMTRARRDRLMFGSDQIIWPGLNNAARFLRLEET